MINTVLICLAVILTGFFFYLCMKRAIARERGSLLAIVASYFEPRGEDKSSEFADLVNVTASIYAEKVSQSLKATFMGMQSVDSRQEQAIKGDIVQDLANQQNPLLGVLLEKYPSVRKRLVKNPELLAMVGDIGAKMFSRHPAGGASLVMVVRVNLNSTYSKGG